MNTKDFIDKEFLLAAVNGKREDFYSRKFSGFLSNHLIAPSWNWAAFIFGMGWFLYRKMPGICLIYMILMSFSHMFVVRHFGIYMGLAYYLIVAKTFVPAYANQIYFMRIMFTLKRLQSKGLSVTETKETLGDRFGVLTQASSTNPEIF